MISEAIKKLYPNTPYVVKGDEWESLDGTVFDDIAIINEKAKMEYLFDLVTTAQPFPPTSHRPASMHPPSHHSGSRRP